MTWKPIKVINKLTGETQIIKDFRFNSEVHQKVGEVESRITATSTIEETLSSLKMHELKKLAKEKGHTVPPTMKKAEILELLNV